MISRSLLVASLLAAPALAGATGYDAQSRKPVHDGSGLFSTWGADPIEAWSVRTGIAVDFARRPVWLDAETGGQIPIVERATGVDGGVVIGLPFAAQLGLSAPFAQHQLGTTWQSDQTTGASTGGLGDLRLDAKWRALRGTASVPSLGVGTIVSFPTGDEESWNGAGVPQSSLLFLADQHIGPIALALNAGYRIRPAEGTVWGARVNDAVLYRGGVGWETPIDRLFVATEIFGAHTSSGVTTLEAGAGAGMRFTSFIVTGGANTAVLESLGSPAWRVWGGFSYEFRPARHMRASRTIAIQKPPPVPGLPPELSPGEEIGVKLVGKTILPSRPVLFSAGLSTLDKDAEDTIEAVATWLQLHPEAKHVAVEGHTDFGESAIVGAIVSSSRAWVVKDRLVRLGIDPARLTVGSSGSGLPLPYGRTEEGKVLNRRVDFILTPDAPAPSPAKPK